MYSYEKQALHYSVVADQLEKAARVARMISEYYNADFYPSEKAEAAKKRLKDLVLSVLDV